MKRWAVLTMIFSLLSVIVVSSGCQVGKTASTTGGSENNADDCTEACIDDCSESCAYNCAHCDYNGQTYDCTTGEGCIAYCSACSLYECAHCDLDGKTYDCTTLWGCTDFWFAYNCSFTKNCFTNMAEGNCNANSPSDEDEEFDFETSKQLLNLGDDYSYIFEERRIIVTFLKDFKMVEFTVSTINKETNEITKTYIRKDVFSSQSVLNIRFEQDEVPGTHVLSITAYGCYK